MADSPDLNFDDEDVVFLDRDGNQQSPELATAKSSGDRVVDQFRTEALSRDNALNLDPKHAALDDQAADKVVADYVVIDMPEEEEFELVEKPQESALDTVYNALTLDNARKAAYVFSSIRDIAVLGASAAFIYFSPTLAMTMGLSIGAASIYDHLVNKDSNFSLTKSILGIGVFSAAAISAFTVSPWASLGIGFVCGSPVKNWAQAIPTALAGIKVPDILVGPALLLSGLAIKASEYFSGPTPAADGVTAKIINWLSDRATSIAGDTLVNLGLKHFETVGFNIINAGRRALDNTLFIFNQIMDRIDPARDYVKVVHEFNAPAAEKAGKLHTQSPLTEIIIENHIKNEHVYKNVPSISALIRDNYFPTPGSYAQRIIAERQLAQQQSRSAAPAA